MRAALILRLARARRVAIVGSVTRKERATSLVVRPPSRRSVSATCASVESAGWQQVKMRRRRSSCTGLVSSGWRGRRFPGVSTATSLSEFLSASLAAQAVDGSIAGRGRDPAARVGRQAVARPCAQGDGERLLDCVLGEVDVAEDADQGGDRSAGLLAEDPADRGLVEPGMASMSSSLSGLGYVSERADLDRLRDCGAWSSTPRRGRRRGRRPR